MKAWNKKENGKKLKRWKAKRNFAPLAAIFSCFGFLAKTEQWNSRVTVAVSTFLTGCSNWKLV